MAFPVRHTAVRLPSVSADCGSPHPGIDDECICVSPSRVQGSSLLQAQASTAQRTLVIVDMTGSHVRTTAPFVMLCRLCPHAH